MEAGRWQIRHTVGYRRTDGSVRVLFKKDEEHNGFGVTARVAVPDSGVVIVVEADANQFLDVGSIPGVSAAGTSNVLTLESMFAINRMGDVTVQSTHDKTTFKAKEMDAIIAVHRLETLFAQHITSIQDQSSTSTELRENVDKCRKKAQELLDPSARRSEVDVEALLTEIATLMKLLKELFPAKVERAAPHIELDATNEKNAENAGAAQGAPYDSMAAKYFSTKLVGASSVADAAFDSVVLVTSSIAALEGIPALAQLSNSLNDYLSLDKNALKTASLVPVEKSIIPSGRLVLAGTGPVDRDFDDVRRFLFAARCGIQLALKAGSQSPLLVTVPSDRYEQNELVAALGAIGALHTPYIFRQDNPPPKAKQLGILGLRQTPEHLLQLVEAFDAAFTVCRDVGDTDPQRMAPPKVADYIKEAFTGGSIKCEVVSDQTVIEKEYPLMAAVNRCANQVPEHQARLIRLEYDGGSVERTLFLVGKGVTIDTGGADVKTGGHMFGMCRDKYGSAVIGGFFKALEILKPRGIRVVGLMCMVRNSIGSYAYTCDEVITSRSGKRVHIYNTDAEGRLTMLDSLTQAREEAEKPDVVAPLLMTIATLTGDETLPYGHHASVMENGPARNASLGKQLQSAGDIYGQPVEISRLHHENFAFHESEDEQVHIRQGNTHPSVATLRGHQSPAAFLTMASRIDEHGLNAATGKRQLPYCHLDIGSCMGDHPDVSFPNPLVALVANFVLPRL